MKKLIPLFVILTTLVAVGCSKGASTSIPDDHNSEAREASGSFFQYPEEVTLYDENVDNAENIKMCVFYKCVFSDSPLLGYQKSTITVEDILKRTMATKPSHIETFKAVLNLMNPEALKMFGSVNAIVISERINPSFYTYSSGAIYLSANYFWRNQAEKATSVLVEDERLAYGKTAAADAGQVYTEQLLYTDFDDYFHKGSQKYLSFERTLKTRTPEQLSGNLIRLLYHELAHANDYFPKSFIDSSELKTDETFSKITTDRWELKKVTSQTMKTELAAPLMINMGKILYQGNTPTEADRNVTAAMLMQDFDADGAAASYAYSSSREDLAMLVETSLMYYYSNYSNVAIFFKYPYKNYVVTEDYDWAIGGGIINKMTDIAVKERTADVLNKIFDPQMSARVISKLDTTHSVLIREDTKWENVFKLF